MCDKEDYKIKILSSEHHFIKTCDELYFKTPEVKETEIEED